MTEEATITRTRFAAGDKIPSWLLDTEPANANSIPGTLRFGCNVDVIDLPDYFMIVPLDWGGIASVIHFDGQQCKLFASAKLVRMTPQITALTVPEPGQQWDTQSDVHSGGAIRFGSVEEAQAYQAREAAAGRGGLFDAHVPPQGFASGQAVQAMNDPAMAQLKHLHDQKMELRGSLWKRIKAVFKP